MTVVAWDCTDDEYRERAYNGMATEIEELRSLLGCALTEHDGNEGEFLPDFMPHHWTHQARRILRRAQ